MKEKNVDFNAKDLKQLVGLVGKKYKKTSFLTSLFVVMEVIIEIFIPLIMAQLINVGMDNSITDFTFVMSFGKWSLPVFTLGTRIQFIVVCGVLTIVLALISMMFGILSGKYAATSSTGFSKNVRRALYYKVQDFSFSNLDHYNTASLVTRLTTDITNIQMSYQMSIRMLVRAPVMLILAIIMAVSINAELSIIFAVALPVLIISLVLTASTVFPRFYRMLKEYDKLNESTQENLTGIRAVKAFVREDYEAKRFKEVSKRVQELEYKAMKIMVIAMPVMQLVMYSCVIAVVWFGGNKIIIGEMSLGFLSAYLSYIMQILMSLMMVGMVFVMYVLSRASAGRVIEVLKEDIDIKEKPNAITTAPVDGSIDFNDVDFSYSKNPKILNLENIDLHIKSGETVGIIGGTGSAKSTLVQLIPRLYDIQDGTLQVGGVDVRDYALDTLRESIGVVLQKNVLFSGTIKENLKWGNPDATDDEIYEATKAAQADDFIRSFPNGYETELGQGGVNVSGGQKQRLCIARALIKKPKIMILDDSTSAVDTATDSKIRDAFKEKFQNTTVLIIAQRISSIQDADKIIVMDKGKIVGSGTHDELLKNNEIYQDVFYSQQKGVEK